MFICFAVIFKGMGVCGCMTKVTSVRYWDALNEVTITGVHHDCRTILTQRTHNTQVRKTLRSHQ
jgi:hypothetical protein